MADSSTLMDLVHKGQEKERLLPPMLTLEALKEGTTLGQARRYLAAVLKAEDELVAQETALIEKHSGETLRIRGHIHEIEHSTIIFQGSRCCVCNRQLELPSVHFLCQHSYHQHCLQGYAENENECIMCLKSNKVLRDMMKSQENSHQLHEEFHSQLKKADDGFAVVADYFGRGVFNKVNIADDSTLPPTIPPAAARGSSKPAILEKQEPKLFHFSSVPSTEQPIPAGCQQEPPLALSISQPIAGSYTKRSPEPDNSLLSSSYKNPFDDENDYDDTKNPFAEEAEDATNPFTSDTNPEYDDELNPFA